MTAFRERYLRFDEIMTVLQSWKDRHPELVHLQTIGKSSEGRDLVVVTIGPEPERVRPAAWVDGNMHASELCGSSVALAIAEDMIELHASMAEGRALPPRHPAAALPDHVRRSLVETLLYVLPRMSPDGAEAVLRDGRYVRSNPRDRRLHAPVGRFRSVDIDGDGRVRFIRKEDPTGEYVEHEAVPGLMRPRTLEDVGPFFKVWPEGVIDDFDGHHVPEPYFLSDNDVDLNRNFPYSWRPEPDQIGAGAYPASEPEARAVVEFHTSHPNVFSWLNLHTFGGVYIRPLGDAPDKKMDASDRALFRHIESVCETFGGYPMVSGYEDFLYEPDKPLHGDLTDFAYCQRGCIAYVCELWDIFARLGMPRTKPFVDNYSRIEGEELTRLAKLDREVNAGRIFQPFKPFVHPQLGDVEIGGLCPLVGIYNPPYELIDETCRAQSAAYLRVMALAPRVEVEHVHTEALASGASEVTVRVTNLGYLPTYVLSSAKKLSFDARLFLDVRTVSGDAQVTPMEARAEVGHLDGWGRGRFSESAFHLGSRGTSSSRTLRFIVRGHGRLEVRASGLRVGATGIHLDV